jgi:uncharacterized protein (TIGR03435 family)
MRRIVPGLLLIAAASVLFAQEPRARPAFEVASIKQSDSLDRGGRSGWEPGGRFRGVNVPGVMLVQIAFGTSSRTLLRYQLDGVPGWLASARYDITGKIRTDLSTTDLAELGSKGPLYLRSLLEDRFKLKVHHESRQLPRYRLVRERDSFGPRFRRSTCATAPESMCTFEYLANRMTFDGVTMGRLADELAGKVDRVVADDTGLSGVFFMDLEWSPDGSSLDTPSVFSAVREQLGLKLEPERGSVDVVVIERVDRPAAD